MRADLHTRFDIQSDPFLKYSDAFFFLGSCFGEHMAERLAALDVAAHSNPFGILYNPVSLHELLHRIADKNYFSEKDLDLFENNYHAFCLPAKFYSENVTELLSILNEKLEGAHGHFHSSNVLCITLGTAFVYTYSESAKIVGNCHKVPGKYFKKSMLEEHEIISSLEKIGDICKKNKKQLLFTISPVKHLRDGVYENAVSKARIQSALYNFCRLANENKYFPSFEIMNEELRDHRFYENDLAHPNAWSREYIFQRWCAANFDVRSREYFVKREALLKMENHRPMGGSGAEFEKWQANLQQARENLKREFEFNTSGSLPR